MSEFRRILVPYDGSDVSTKALVSALSLARDDGGRILLLHVVDELAFAGSYEYGSAALIESVKAEGSKALERAAAICESSGVPFDSRLIDNVGSRLGDTVAAEAKAWNADLVVVGTHGRRGVSRALLGSGAEQIIRLAPVPVLVVRENAAER